MWQFAGFVKLYYIQTAPNSILSDAIIHLFYLLVHVLCAISIKLGYFSTNKPKCLMGADYKNYAKTNKVHFVHVVLFKAGGLKPPHNGPGETTKCSARARCLSVGLGSGRAHAITMGNSNVPLSVFIPILVYNPPLLWDADHKNEIPLSAHNKDRSNENQNQ